MRGRAVALALAMLALGIGFGHAEASPDSKLRPYSRAWLAKFHARYDNAATALYELRSGYTSGGSALGSDTAPRNIRMSNPGFAGSQNEFQIDINPTDHRFAIGASNDGRTSGTGYYRTSDRGRTWFPADMPGIGSSCCDPGVAYAFDGTAYFVNLDLSPAAAHVLRSADNGVTWVKRTDIAVEDRPNIVVDNGSTSPHKGRLYVTWSDFATFPAESPDEIRLYYSDNGGGTWTGPINVSHVTGPGGAYPQSSQPRVADDGTVYVGFQYYPDGTYSSAEDRIARSADGGQTFQPSVVISDGPRLQGGLDLGDQRGYFAINGSCTTFRHRSFPIVGIDPANSRHVYAVWAGGNLEQPYSCGSFQGVHSDILFSRSTNGGATWSAPLKVNDDPPGRDQYYPWLDVAPNGEIWIGWHDRRNDPNNFKHVYYVDRSTDGGLSFGTDMRVGTVPSLPDFFIGDYAGLAAENDLVLPMWWDSRNSSSGDPYTARIRP